MSEYPELAEHTLIAVDGDPLFTAAEMRAYVDADRVMRAGMGDDGYWKHAKEMAKHNWQCVKCDGCGGEFARAFPAPKDNKHAGRAEFWIGVVLGYASGIVVAIIGACVVRFMSA